MQTKTFKLGIVAVALLASISTVSSASPISIEKIGCSLGVNLDSPISDSEAMRTPTTFSILIDGQTWGGQIQKTMADGSVRTGSTSVSYDKKTKTFEFIVSESKFEGTAQDPYYVAIKVQAEPKTGKGPVAGLFSYRFKNDKFSPGKIINFDLQAGSCVLSPAAK